MAEEDDVRAERRRRRAASKWGGSRRKRASARGEECEDLTTNDGSVEGEVDTKSDVTRRRRRRERRSSDRYSHLRRAFHSSRFQHLSPEPLRRRGDDVRRQHLTLLGPPPPRPRAYPRNTCSSRDARPRRPVLQRWRRAPRSLPRAPPSSPQPLVCARRSSAGPCDTRRRVPLASRLRFSRRVSRGQLCTRRPARTCRRRL